MDLGPAELGIILVIVLVVFGGAKLPQLARSLGEARREFERASGPTAGDDAAEAGPADGQAPTAEPS